MDHLVGRVVPPASTRKTPTEGCTQVGEITPVQAKIIEDAPIIGTDFSTATLPSHRRMPSHAETG